MDDEEEVYELTDAKDLAELVGLFLAHRPYEPHLLEEIVEVLPIGVVGLRVKLLNGDRIRVTFERMPYVE